MKNILPLVKETEPKFSRHKLFGCELGALDQVFKDYREG